MRIRHSLKALHRDDGLPGRVDIVEVGPRDGLQNEKTLVSASDKVAFIQALAACGFPDIEVTSFVSPKWVPQLADAAEVLTGLGEPPRGVCYSTLVPNLAGMERAIQSGVRRVAVFTAASETFNQKNINASIAESLERFKPVMEMARSANVSVRGYLSTAFVCPYEGPVNPSAAARVVRQLFELGVDEVSIGDTIGAAVPRQVHGLLDELAEDMSADRLAMHFHDTRGTALTNVMAALERGITIFDASAGGLGGCPFAPGATGNLATEDLVYFLDGMGIETGVDLRKVCAASNALRAAAAVKQPSRVLEAMNATERDG
ncbi:MAG: hydroxymethylglutaryl-CoA lyase [Candidatus Eisenbacteria bacterium]|nr:hydroxymethylglutaryl-CoA lyase [Candidatus Eisenbacteria bacterium]